MDEPSNRYGPTAARAHGRPGRETRPASTTIDAHAHAAVPEAAAFAAGCGDLPWAWLGRVTDDGRFTLRVAETMVADLSVSALDSAWRAPSRAHAGGSC